MRTQLMEECSASQIVMGADYPYPWTSTAVGAHARDNEPERCRAGGDPGR